jgi:hypothetical protein
MSKIQYSATFKYAAGDFTITRKSRQDYGYTVAWCVRESGVVYGKGFSRQRSLAERAAYDILKCHVKAVALFAPVEVEVDATEGPKVPRRRQVPQWEAAE